nr:hypothetical protein [Tanacetum cinerariifolium]
MSLDDVYNHLKVYEPKVQKRAGSNLQNMAFISSSNTSNGKSKVPTVQGASTASAQVPTVNTDVAAASLSYDTFITIQGSDVAGFNKSKVECFNCHKMDQGEDLLVGDTVKDSDKSADKGSDSIYEMSDVLGSLGAANILASKGLRSVFTTASLSVATASIDISPVVATASGSFPTVVIFTIVSVTTPTTRLDRSNKMIAKYLSEYEQAAVGLSHDKKVELINELLMYQRHLAQIKKYQAQQNKPATKTDRRNFYMTILRSNARWKVKDFKRMTFEQIEEKFIPVTTEVIDEKAKELWVELKRLYEPDSRDLLWAIQSPYKPTTVLNQVVAATNDSPLILEHTKVETPMNMSPANKAHFEAEKEAIHLILTGIGVEIYSTVDACQIAQEMWEAIE